MDDDEGWLGIDLSGVQPEIVAGLGHNSEAEIICRINKTIDNLVQLSEDHQKSLEVLVEKQEDEREEMLLVLGKELLAGRKPFDDENGKLKNDRGFGEWISCNFPNLQLVINKNEQVASIWAAEFPEQRQEMLDKYPRVRTTRGAYAKWSQEQKKLEETSDTSNDDDVVSDEDTSVTSAGTTSSSGGSSGNNRSQGSSGVTHSNNSDNGKGGINTSNPDTSVVKIEATMIASSLIGVVTNMLVFEQTQGRPVNKRELASAIFDEIRTKSVDQLTEDEIEDYIENNLKRTLNIILESLPVLDGFESNVVNLNKTLENF